MKGIRFKKISARSLVLIIVFIIFSMYSVSLVYPLIWAFLNSLKNNLEFFRAPFALPEDWLFSNFAEAFSAISIRTTQLVEVNLFGMFGNSLWFTLGSSFLQVATSAMTAYVVSKYEFKCRNFIYGLAIFIMIIPIVGNLPAQYKLFNQLGMKNSPTILLAYTSGFGFGFIILYGFFKNISWYYAEAAFVDGAGNLRVFLSIMIPQAMPALTSLFIITAIGSWNDYMTPLLYMGDFPTLASGLYRFKEIMSNAESNYPVYFAGILISVIPILVLFAFFSETIMENTVAGGLKG